MEQEYDREEVFEFLDLVQRTGVTNMLGASPYLQQHFEMNRSTSHYFLKEWIKLKQTEAELEHYLRS